MTETITFEVDDTILVEVPIFQETTNRVSGRNWLARIALDPLAPGGLFRDFEHIMDYVNPAYTTGKLREGDPIEFGADVYSHTGKRLRVVRWYGVIRKIDAVSITVEQFKSARKAIAGGTARPKPRDPCHPDISERATAYIATCKKFGSGSIEASCDRALLRFALERSGLA